MSRFTRVIPVILAFGLLILQISVPWASRNFTTQDGPSHLYMARLVRNALFEGGGSIYTLQAGLTSNWGTVAVVNAASLFVKPDRLEAVLFGVCVLLGFFSFSYFRHSLDPIHSPWTPIAVFLTNVWFIWIGFYNFYLGMALCAFILGYHIRHAAKPRLKDLIWLSLLLIAAFFVHVVPLTLALLGVAVVTVWVQWIVPQLERSRPALTLTLRRSWRIVALTFVATVPSGVLLCAFAASAGPSNEFVSNFKWAWNVFPMHVFAAARGRASEHAFLWPAMLFYMIAGLIAMRRREWASPRGAIALLVFLTLGLYLFLPNAGFGGAEVKIRFSWALFVFGCLLASTVRRIRALAIPVALYVTVCETSSLLEAIEVNSKNVSRAVAAYTSATAAIPQGATVVRLRCPSKEIRERFGYDVVASEPLLHADSLAAVKGGFIDLTDYQPLSDTFPVAVRPVISKQEQGQLWDLEGSVPGSSGPALKSILNGFPVPIHYVVVLGGDDATEAILREYAPRLRLVSTDTAKSLVRVYEVRMR